jgi:glycosyltransferase involved in cell wall biosynthesis
MLRRERPDVFHAHLSWPLAARAELATAILSRVPAVVATFHLFPPVALGRTGPLQGRLLARRAGRAVAVSDAIATSLVDVFRWPPDKIRVVRNGIVVERFQKPCDPKLRRLLAGDADEFVFLTVARLDGQKGLDVLLRAAAAVSGARFAIAGAGAERERLARLVEQLGLDGRVRFLGHRTDVAELLAACDAFVLPSRFEGTPLAVLEAMAAAKPIVTSAISGTDELVTDGETALLVPADDPAALAVALRRMLDDAGLRDRLAVAGRRRVEADFSAAGSAAQVTAVYDELLSR